MGLFDSLSKTRAPFKQLFSSRNALSDDKLLSIEDALLQADCGIDCSDLLIDALKQNRGDQWQEALRSQILSLLSNQKNEFDLAQAIEQSEKPYSILLLGVNGSGKTTTIGKIASFNTLKDKRVWFASADTFRAAASEQLTTWANRTNASILKDVSKDPSATIYMALEKATSAKADLLLIDTAGRQFNHKGLMAELEKIYRTMQKIAPHHPHQTWLVLDASSGQNALHQARAFQQSIPISGCILNKLDGTSKGGMIIPLIHELNLPVYYLGIGESPSDLIPFKAEAFVQNMIPPLPSK